MKMGGGLTLNQYIMKHKNLLLTLPFVFWTFAGISLSSCKDTPVRKLYKSDIDWKLTWQDEFEKDGTPDPEKWVFSPCIPFAGTITLLHS